MQLVVVVSSFNLALTFIGHIFSLLIVYFSIITLNKGNVGTNHMNNRILLFVCTGNRKVIYYYYITLPSINTITITITFGNFQSITITGKSGYYILQLHITITPSLGNSAINYDVFSSRNCIAYIYTSCTCMYCCLFNLSISC